jgi:hypothetical protein
MKALLMTLAVLFAAAINLGSFVVLAGKTGDGYWTVGDGLLYVLSLAVAAAIVVGAGRAIYYLQ